MTRRTEYLVASNIVQVVLTKLWPSETSNMTAMNLAASVELQSAEVLEK